jgi:hypothetical protein
MLAEIFMLRSETAFREKNAGARRCSSGDSVSLGYISKVLYLPMCCAGPGTVEIAPNICSFLTAWEPNARPQSGRKPSDRRDSSAGSSASAGLGVDDPAKSEQPKLKLAGVTALVSLLGAP